MPRPRYRRRVRHNPEIKFFKPANIPVRELETINLAVEELEAVRLADLENMYQEDAAESMGISRQTFGRIIKNARTKIAEALVKGKALSIEGGDFVHPAAEAGEPDISRQPGRHGRHGGIGGRHGRR
ncbi:MAG: DUF134 domain-containing protein [Vulcanimicrobiota bacterium]